MQRQSSFNDETQGCLYLVPTPIGNLEDITLRAKRILMEVDYIAAEDTRTSGILLEKIGVHNKMISFHKYNSKQRAPELIALMKEGKKIAEISDAGMPVISDPGFILVQECIKNDIAVIPLPGPSAFATALIASGFLSRKATEQTAFFNKMATFTGTSIFYEAPHRLLKTLTNLQKVVGENREIVCARELTKIHEEFIRGSIGEITNYFAENAPRGEFVILLSPAKEEETISIDQMLVEVNQAVASGMSNKDAIKNIAKKYNISKNELYDKYHQK